MNKTSIEWTHRPETGGPAGGFTWNPIRARLKGQGPKVRSGTFCTRISPGCTNCYASVINKRFGTGLEFTVPNLAEHEFSIDERILEEPLRRAKPSTIFVGDMFDLFHEAIDVTLVGRVFGMMAKCPQHTFQVLTKRAGYMKEILSRAQKYNDQYLTTPLPNVWLGVSVESQKYADERIPLLLQTPAAVRFLSVEPMLEAVRLDECAPYVIDGDESNPGVLNAFTAMVHHPLTVKFAPEKAARPDGISWVICGGESGPGARPFNLAWAESLLSQCRAAGVPFFMKQLGSRPIVNYWHWLESDLSHGQIAIDLKGLPPNSPRDTTVPVALLKDRKGGDPLEWPEHLRVREFPTSQKAEAMPA